MSNFIQSFVFQDLKGMLAPNILEKWLNDLVSSFYKTFLHLISVSLLPCIQNRSSLINNNIHLYNFRSLGLIIGKKLWKNDTPLILTLQLWYSRCISIPNISDLIDWLINNFFQMKFRSGWEYQILKPNIGNYLGKNIYSGCSTR